MTFLAFYFSKVGNVFLQYDGIVRSPPIGKEIDIGLANEGGEKGLYPVGNDFAYQLVVSVA